MALSLGMASPSCPRATCLVTLLWPSQPAPCKGDDRLSQLCHQEEFKDPHSPLQKCIGKQQAETKNRLPSFVQTAAAYLGCSRHDSTLIIFIELEIRLQYSQIIALLALYYSFYIIYLH